MAPPHKLDAEVDRCIAEGATKAAGRSLHEEALWLHEVAPSFIADASIVEDVELTWEEALAEATLALGQTRRDTAPITRHPGLLGLWLEAERTAERAGVSLAAMLASHQGAGTFRSRPRVERALFVANWKERGEYGGLLRRLLHASPRAGREAELLRLGREPAETEGRVSDETVLKAQRRGEEELERRRAEHLAEYEAFDRAIAAAYQAERERRNPAL
jgi:hypothetical protein